MAHGKETPRQKMIGMMYLVLTALLALNVSKEAVEAFKRVDEGLTKTTANFMQKNAVVYSDFDAKAIANPTKAGPWVKIAHSVRGRSNELYDYIQALKVEIVKKAEGENSEALDGTHVITEHIKRIDDTNIPSEIMIGSNNNGKAFDLKAAIIDYREFLLEQIGEGRPNITSAIQNGLLTEDVSTLKGKELWETHNFQSLPLVAVVTILSKMQNDVRNAEADALDFFYSQIGAADIRVNKLEPIVMGSNYVLRGGQYSGKVFIAAMDSTAKPEILVGDYEEVEGPGGMKDYRMVGDYETLTIDENGMGVYNVAANTLGEKTYKGLIKVTAPDGSVINHPFEGNYTVAQPNVVVSPTAMNVFYIGVDNPVDISVPGGQNVRANMTNGRIRPGRHPRFRSTFIVQPARPGITANVTVSAEVNGVRRTFPAVPFRVKDVPDPVAKIGLSKGGNIARNILVAQQGVIAELENFDFDLTFRVTGFKVSINSQGYMIDAESSNNRFTAAQKALLNRLRRNQSLLVSDIKAVGPDGRTRNLPPIAFKIQ